MDPTHVTDKGIKKACRNLVYNTSGIWPPESPEGRLEDNIKID
jgi:hypothetical protein